MYFRQEERISSEAQILMVGMRNKIMKLFMEFQFMKERKK